MAADSLRARQAALLVHALPAHVRRQVMARLGAAESSQLQPLLLELAQLGVSPELGEKLQRLASSQGSGADAGPPGVAQSVERLSADHVSARLAACASTTVAQLLRVQDWSWKAQVLNAMADGRRAEVLNCMRSEAPPLGPAALQVLCERLCIEPAHVPAQVPPSRRGARGALRVRIRRALGWMR